MKKILLLSLYFFCFIQFAYSQCNGYSELCAKKYNEVTTVMTHNAFNNTEDGFLLTNQTYGIQQQLEDGVRGLMIDVYNVDGVITVYHGFPALGIEPLSEDLGEIKTFLDDNPNEIISIIFQSDVTALDIENELNNAGLMSYLHHHTLGAEWSTLQEMIDADERLVIFSESNDGAASQTWYHYAWAHVFDTNYSYSLPTEFDCDVNRGSISNSLYLVNHWITSAVGTGDIVQANIVNPNPFLIDRLQLCEAENGRLPNFIGVDFYEIGGAFEAAEILNGIGTTSQENLLNQNTVRVFPNPANTIIEVTSTLKSKQYFMIYDMWGREVAQYEMNGSLSIPCDDFAKGVYIYLLKNENGEMFDEGKLEVIH